MMNVNVPLVKLDNCEKVAGVFMDVLESMEPDDQKKELFMVAGVDTKNRIIYAEIVSIGCLNEAISRPREVFRKAIVNSSGGIITCHNHPSGDPTPSENDKVLTGALRKAGDILDIKLVDHVIIGRSVEDGYYSFKKEGDL